MIRRSPLTSVVAKSTATFRVEMTDNEDEREYRIAHYPEANRNEFSLIWIITRTTTDKKIKRHRINAASRSGNRSKSTGIKTRRTYSFKWAIQSSLDWWKRRLFRRMRGSWTWSGGVPQISASIWMSASSIFSYQARKCRFTRFLLAFPLALSSLYHPLSLCFCSIHFDFTIIIVKV